MKVFPHRWGNISLQRPAADRLIGRIIHPAFSGIVGREHAFVSKDYIPNS